MKDNVKKSPWLSLLQQLPLSKSEQEVVKRFAQDPSGRSFLPVADILRSHRLVEESIELLSQGVQMHPHFAVARVVLAREYFLRGMALDCWRMLDESPVDLSDNVLAQKLKFKLAVAFGDDHAADQAYRLLERHQGIDGEVRKLADNLQRQGIVTTRDQWRKELALQGVRIDFSLTLNELGVPERNNEQDRDTKGAKGARFILDYKLDELTRREVSGFHVMALNEVFAGESDTPGKNMKSAPHQQQSGAIELDSTTLADIYAKQGHFTKALGIYRRLLRLAPHNDLLRLKVSELSRLEKNQQADDLAEDPVTFERLEVVQIIDRQMRFYTHLLSRLNDS